MLEKVIRNMSTFRQNKPSVTTETSCISKRFNYTLFLLYTYVSQLTLIFFVFIQSPLEIAECQNGLHGRLAARLVELGNKQELEQSLNVLEEEGKLAPLLWKQHGAALQEHAREIILIGLHNFKVYIFKI